MTLPPPQDPFGSQPSSGGGGSQWSGPGPQGAPSPYAGGGQPQGAPQYGQQPGAPWQQQQSWAGGPPPPPNKGGKGKWILVGLALVAVIAVSVVGTVLVLRPESGGGSGQPPNAANGASEFASANDTGPANIITEDPTCEAWVKISHGLDEAVPEWNKQDYSVPAAEWTPQQRAVFEQQGVALTTAIANVANLAKQTPHRVMRELYGQYMAYSQAAIDAFPTYSSTDNEIVAVSNRLFSVLNRVCDAIYFRAAQQTAPLVAPPPSPSDARVPNDDGKLPPERFLKNNDGSCSDWTAMVGRFEQNGEAKAWGGLDPKIRASEWAPEHKAVMDAVVPVLVGYADDAERLGRQSGNPIWEDFAVLGAQYMRAYVQSIPTYAPNSAYMSVVSTTVVNAVNWACKAES